MNSERKNLPHTIELTHLPTPRYTKPNTDIQKITVFRIGYSLLVWIKILTNINFLSRVVDSRKLVMSRLETNFTLFITAIFSVLIKLGLKRNTHV